MKKSSRNRRKQARFRKLVKEEAHRLILGNPLGHSEYLHRSTSLTTVRCVNFLMDPDAFNKTEINFLAQKMQKGLIEDAILRGLVHWEPLIDGRLEAKIQFVKS